MSSRHTQLSYSPCLEWHRIIEFITQKKPKSKSNKILHPNPPIYLTMILIKMSWIRFGQYRNELKNTPT